MCVYVCACVLSPVHVHAYMALTVIVYNRWIGLASYTGPTHPARAGWVGPGYEPRIGYIGMAWILVPFEWQVDTIHAVCDKYTVEPLLKDK